MLLCGDFCNKFTQLINDAALSQNEKNIILARYINIVKSAEIYYLWVNILFCALTNIVTIATILIAALISLERAEIVQKQSAGLFWTVFALSIAAALCNKWLYSFNIHKKYVLNIVILEKLYSEGFMFISGIDKYASVGDMRARFKLFCTRIEKIKLKSINEIPEMENSGISDDILAMAPHREHLHRSMSINIPQVIVDGENIYSEDIEPTS